MLLLPEHCMYLCICILAFHPACCCRPGLMAFLRAVAFDSEYHQDHNMITGVGLRCWLDAVAECEYGAGLWFGTRCSSFVGLCRNGHGRSAKNGYWGHRKKNFVRVGNLMMAVGSFSIFIQLYSFVSQLVFCISFTECTCST